MIRFSLKCSKGDVFESWFASGEAFEALRASGHLACAICGDGTVEKTLMAPAVRPARAVPDAEASPLAGPPAVQQQPIKPVLSVPDKASHEKLAALRRHVEENADYVGSGFAREARKMHLGEAPERAIYGEARLEEAKALVEDGVPVAPLPFVPRSKTN